MFNICNIAAAASIIYGCKRTIRSSAKWESKTKTNSKDNLTVAHAVGVATPLFFVLIKLNVGVECNMCPLDHLPMTVTNKQRKRDFYAMSRLETHFHGHSLKRHFLPGYVVVVELVLTFYFGY